MDFTVIIPTFNGAERFPEVLNCLKAQMNTESIQWEVIVVDNNSQDQTPQVVEAFQADWPGAFPLKYVLEPQQGVAFARQAGIGAAQGEWVGFIDDDNWPDPDWVIEAWKFGQDYPQAGAYGGQIHANYQVSPPPNFEKIEGFLAIRERGDQPNRYQPEVLSLPPGAALVVRRRAWLEAVPSQPHLRGKLPNGKMVQGDDWEPLMYLHRAGWEIWYNPAMETYHQIPSQRLERDYLLSLIHGSCLSFYPLKMMAAEPNAKPLILARTVLGNLYKAAQYFVQNRQQLKHNTVAACELQIYLSRVASPFYFFIKA
ncbi:MAG: glycosyltransferase family 2 protein [Oscillatoriales cyanobacterium SM2_3_0]|nr:glycosyltransferase family 2 protein [Oscillatoriales cyanobacterium SM2_3_0]